MKKLEQLGKTLSREEMKSITGGGQPCTTSYDCTNACINDPNLIQGYYCKNGICTLYPYCP